MLRKAFGPAIFIAAVLLHGAEALPQALNPASSPAPFGRYTENIHDVKLEMVRMPNGTFLMGNDRSPNPEEKPAHQVRIRSFYIGRYEVTRQQWNIVAEQLPRVNRTLSRQYIADYGFTADTPADVIGWDDALEFCERLTLFTGKRYRLPSEAEWEYACRAGTQTEYSFGDEFNQALVNMVFANDGILPVGKMGYANNWGLYDMHGNAGEWVQDVQHSNYSGAPTDGSAWMQGGEQSRRISRGGAFRQRAEVGRSSSRFLRLRTIRTSWDGFRVAAEVTPFPVGNVSATSAASYSGTSLAPESIATLFGNSLSQETVSATSLPLPTTLAGASISIQDSSGQEYLAPLFFSSPNQINFLIPSAVTPGPAVVRATRSDGDLATGSINVTRISPGLFSADASGVGLAAAIVLRIKSNGEQTYEQVAQFDPATNQFAAVPIDLSDLSEQVFLILFGTGFRNRSELSNVEAVIGGLGVQVLFAGAQGVFAGVDQCNVRLPNSLAGRGEVDITLAADGHTANKVRVSIR